MLYFFLLTLSQYNKLKRMEVYKREGKIAEKDKDGDQTESMVDLMFSDTGRLMHENRMKRKKPLWQKGARARPPSDQQMRIFSARKQKRDEERISALIVRRLNLNFCRHHCF